MSGSSSLLVVPVMLAVLLIVAVAYAAKRVAVLAIESVTKVVVRTVAAESGRE